MPCTFPQVEADLEKPEDASPALPASTRPSYAERFRCIASACEDTCCTGWTIPIDRRTVEAYRADPVLGPFTQLLVLNPTPTPADAARMPLTSGGACAFLNQERLCAIHQHFGPAKLSAACHAYPRETTQRFGERETALDLSCPEAARLTLLDPDLLGAGFSQAELPGRFAEILAYAERLPGGYHPLLALREFVLLVLADRTCSLAQRLQILGVATAALQSLAEAARLEPADWLERNPERLARLLARLLTRRLATAAPLSAIISPLLPRGVPRTPVSAFFPEVSCDRVNAARQLYFAQAILRQRLAESPILPRFRECLDDVQEGLHLDLRGATVPAASVEAYAHAARSWLTPLLDRYPHLLENLIVNHVFKYHYPLGRQPENSTNLVENHTFLCTQVALLQTLLVGMAARHEDQFAPGHVIKLVQTLARAIEHRHASLEAIADFAHAHGLDKLSELTSLLELPGCQKTRQDSDDPSSRLLPEWQGPSSCAAAWALAADRPGVKAERLPSRLRPTAFSGR